MPYRNPEQARAYWREYRRFRRAGDTCSTPGSTRLALDLRLETAADLLAMLEVQIEDVAHDDEIGTVERARTLGYLGTVALKCIEAGDLAARLEALEAVLKTRKESA